MSTSVLWDIESDPALAGAKFIAKHGRAGLYQVGSSLATVGKEWNGRFRDDVRAFFRPKAITTVRIADRLLEAPRLRHKDRDGEGKRQLCSPVRRLHAQRPRLLQQKHNQANGKANRDGADDNRSWNCGRRGLSDDRALEQLRNRQVKNFLTVTMLSLGMPMIGRG